MFPTKSSPSTAAIAVLLFLCAHVGPATGQTKTKAAPSSTDCSAVPVQIALRGNDVKLPQEERALLASRFQGWFSVASLIHSDAYSQAVKQAERTLRSMSNDRIAGLVLSCNQADLTQQIIFASPQNGFLKDPLEHAMACFTMFHFARERETDERTKRILSHWKTRTQYVQTIFSIQEGRNAANPKVMEWITARNGGGFATISDVRNEDVYYCINYYGTGLTARVK
jgi:hypothetical protein